jgi:hypothetical protein
MPSEPVMPPTYMTKIELLKNTDTGKLSKNRQFPLFYHNIAMDGKISI